MLQRLLSPARLPPRLAVGGHVLIVTPGFPADENDASCIPPLQVMLLRLARVRPDLTVTVISLHYPGSRRPFDWHGLEVIPLGAGSRRWPLRLADLARGFAAVNDLHRKQPVDAVHALWLTDAAMLAWLIARRLRLPLTATAMGQDVLPSNRYLRWLPLSRMRLAAVSERAAAALRTTTGITADVVMPWGLDARHSGRSAAWSQRPVHLLGVGSLTHNKHYSSLLQVCRSFRETGRPCTAVLFGDGPQYGHLRAEAERLELDSTLQFMGHRPRHEVLECMRTARILVHPAQFEGFGFVFSEALASGMSVVSRPVGPAAEGPRWRVGNSDEDFFAACADFMDNPPATDPVELFPANRTVEAFCDLLGSVRESGP